MHLNGRDLTGPWAGQPQWCILESSFGAGIGFLSARRAWKDDPRRPRLLHVVSVLDAPFDTSELLAGLAGEPELLPFADVLAAQWFGLLPGVHRLVFEQGHVLLTLYVGDLKGALRELPFRADSVFVHGEHSVEPAAWDVHTYKAIARHCRRGTIIEVGSATTGVRESLAQCGFVMHPHGLQGIFDPAWEPRGLAAARISPGTCAVVGGGLAGVAAAASMARRGWRVTVFDSAAIPASGASAVPVGMLTAHHSPDDNLLSRLSRAGVRATLNEARSLLREGEDWQATGVLEHRVGLEPLTVAAPLAMRPWTRDASDEEKIAAGLDSEACAYWHEQAGWIKPAALVQAWLAQAGIEWRGNSAVERIERVEESWRLLGATAHELSRADLVIVAAAHASGTLSKAGLPLQPVRGQVSWNEEETSHDLPPFPVNGNGHFMPHVPMGNGPAWFCGSTFDRDVTDLAPSAADHLLNLERLSTLLPGVARQLEPAFSNGSVKAWTGIRCASSDRRPLLGEVSPGLWVTTAMGSRGLTFAVLCAELLAARLHAEPLPLEARLAQALDISRLRASFQS